MKTRRHVADHMSVRYFFTAAVALIGEPASFCCTGFAARYCTETCDVTILQSSTIQVSIAFTV
jgi:hypothetical protein